MNNQYRLLWSSISTSKKIKAVQGNKWFCIGCHLVYTWLLPWADDDGRLRGEPIWILANILPAENLNIKEIENILKELNRVKLISWYEILGEGFFIQIHEWEDHQKIRKDRYKPSSYPYQPTDNQLTTNCPQNVILSPSPSPSPSPIKKFIPPLINDVVNYFLEKGYSAEIGKKAFEYYDTAGWKDSQGNQVRNWKQKMIAVWFKEENKRSQVYKAQNSPLPVMGKKLSQVEIKEFLTKIKYKIKKV